LSNKESRLKGRLKRRNKSLSNSASKKRRRWDWKRRRGGSKQSKRPKGSLNSKKSGMKWREKLLCSERSFSKSRKSENRLQKNSIKRWSLRNRRSLKSLRKNIRQSRQR
jgi:hypothetical protein